jgi:hypothetical protein
MPAPQRTGEAKEHQNSPVEMNDILGVERSDAFAEL